MNYAKTKGHRVFSEGVIKIREFYYMEAHPKMSRADEPAVFLNWVDSMSYAEM